MQTELLANRADAIPLLARWYQAEWAPYYGPDGPGDALADLHSRSNLKKLPIGLVAIQNNEVLGTVALDLDPATNLKPSVVGLLVAPEWRGKGVATALLAAAEHLAKQLGCDKLYISTDILSDMLVRKGWRQIGEVEFLNRAQGSILERKF